MSQPPLNSLLSFSPQRRQGTQTQPAMKWDIRYPAHYASVSTSASSSPGRTVPTSVLSQPVTSPPVPYFRVVSGILPFPNWTIDVRNPRGVTVGDVLTAIYKHLRNPMSQDEWAYASVPQQQRVADAYRMRCSQSSDPKYEQSQGIRRIDWFLKHTVFVGLNPSPDAPYTWTLTTKRYDS